MFATGSGAGCGDRWPLCNGVMLVRAPRIKTVIEFIHRATSGLALACVAALCLWAFRLFPPGHQAHRFAVLSVLFLFVCVAGGGPGSVCDTSRRTPTSDAPPIFLRIW